MKYLSIALIYIAFFSLIGGAIWLTESLMPLLALLLTPTINIKENAED